MSKPEEQSEEKGLGPVQAAHCIRNYLLKSGTKAEGRNPEEYGLKSLIEDLKKFRKTGEPDPKQKWQSFLDSYELAKERVNEFVRTDTPEADSSEETADRIDAEKWLKTVFKRFAAMIEKEEQEAVDFNNKKAVDAMILRLKRFYDREEVLEIGKKIDRFVREKGPMAGPMIEGVLSKPEAGGMLGLSIIALVFGLGGPFTALLVVLNAPNAIVGFAMKASEGDPVETIKAIPLIGKMILPLCKAARIDLEGMIRRAESRVKKKDVRAKYLPDQSKYPDNQSIETIQGVVDPAKKKPGAIKRGKATATTKPPKKRRTTDSGSKNPDGHRPKR